TAAPPPTAYPPAGAKVIAGVHPATATASAAASAIRFMMRFPAEFSDCLRRSSDLPPRAPDPDRFDRRHGPPPGRPAAPPDRPVRARPPTAHPHGRPPPDRRREPDWRRRRHAADDGFRPGENS